MSDLTTLFDAVAFKVLSRVDLPFVVSNQHELNATVPLRNLFATLENVELECTWYQFAESGTRLQPGSLKCYDARAKSAERTGRSEWRVYYKGDFLSDAEPGDVIILARKDAHIHAMLFDENSPWLRSAATLFGITEIAEKYQTFGPDELKKQDLNLVRELILREMGFEFESRPASSDTELMLSSFGKTIPPTAVMSEFARKHCGAPVGSADDILMAWLQRETDFYYALERVIVEEQIDAGFKSVEHFLEFSISIQNSRRARRGLSLQNQLAALFERNGLKFQAQAKTEHKQKPDFLFPGAEQYHDAGYPADKLVMLAAKTTAKDRWRQILTEAVRIPVKHLCTLEPSISRDQTEEMARQEVQLVLPEPLHATYTTAQRACLLTLEQFISQVKSV